MSPILIAQQNTPEAGKVNDFKSEQTATFDSPPPQPGPCDQIVEACAKAGFTRGSFSTHGPRDLDNACLNPILNGQKIDGVDVPKPIAEQCLGAMPKHVKAKMKPHVKH